MIIFQRFSLFKKTRKAIEAFESRFWSGTNADDLFKQISENEKQVNNTSAIFAAGYNEFQRLSEKPHITPAAIMEGTTRAMRIAETRELEKLENNPFIILQGSRNTGNTVLLCKK